MKNDGAGKTAQLHLAAAIAVSLQASAACCKFIWQNRRLPYISDTLFESFE
jgi:hypothetical protein